MEIGFGNHWVNSASLYCATSQRQQTAINLNSSNLNITQLLAQAMQGDSTARDVLLPHLYEHLRRLARLARRREPSAQTFNTTALVHELYLDVFAQKTPEFADRQNFYRYAARAMQNILIDHARQRLAQKRGSGVAHEPIEELSLRDDGSALQLLALHEALSHLQVHQPRVAQVLELKFFAGLEESAVAELLQIDERTVRRDWQKARAHVLLQMQDISILN